MPQTPAATSLNILIVDDEINIRKILAMSLEADGHKVIAVSNAADAINEARIQPFDLAFVDLRLGRDLGIDLIPGLLGQSPWIKVVIITAHGSIDTAVETMKRGAADYLTKPFTPTQVRLVTERVSRVRALEQQLAGLHGMADRPDVEITFKTSSPAMQRAVALARDVAADEATVLLRGESGTGKGILARAIHSWSRRAAKMFTVVSCPALSPQLLESELFGHKKGAFTGAVQDNPGRISASDGGTLFLDEIGDLPIELQPKLLRFVQDREYERVGDSAVRRADVRVITATNVDLEEAVRANRFREDLLYRINVVQIDLPPLRERADDIVEMAERFLAVLGRTRGIAGFTPEALSLLKSYPWPGNIRELRNAIERAAILCKSDKIGVELLPSNTAAQSEADALGDPISLDKLEELHIRRILARAKSLDEAAKTLGIDVATLWRRRRKYKI
jgi:NtrC-family two-component system response regulator AlgB